MHETASAVLCFSTFPNGIHLTHRRERCQYVLARIDAYGAYPIMVHGIPQLHRGAPAAAYDAALGGICPGEQHSG